MARGLESSHPKIRQLDVAVGIKKNIFRLEIAVANIETMTIGEGCDDLSKKADGLYLRERPAFGNIVKQFSAFNIFKNKVSKGKRGNLSRLAK